MEGCYGNHQIQTRLKQPPTLVARRQGVYKRKDYLPQSVYAIKITQNTEKQEKDTNDGAVCVWC